MEINWGLVGCGDVTEMKSGPAFNKVPHSSLIAVMRRDAAKAADYAKRHNVPKWYNDAGKLINDPEVNAIYIATPPDTHEAYTLAAINAGKSVYVEKPMALNYAAAKNMAVAAAEKNIKLSVAHYRREQPLFKKIKQLLQANTVGKILLVQLEFCAIPYTATQLNNPHYAWRVNPASSGGGLFHDLAPHQLDLMYYFFGPVKKINGIATNQCGNYAADDMVAGNILFSNGIVFNGSWCFNAAAATDICKIIGTEGEIQFSVFSSNIVKVISNAKTESFSFDKLQHVQQPLIEKVVQYFLGNTANPCSGDDGTEVMRMMEEMVNR